MKITKYLPVIFFAAITSFVGTSRAGILLTISELSNGQTQWQITAADPATATGTNSNLDLSIKLTPNLFVTPFTNQSFPFSAPIGIARNVTNPQSNNLSSVGDTFNTTGFVPYILASGAMITSTAGDTLQITNTATVTSPILFSNIVQGSRGFDGGIWGTVSVTTVAIPEPSSVALLLCGLGAALVIAYRKTTQIDTPRA